MNDRTMLCRARFVLLGLRYEFNDEPYAPYCVGAQCCRVNSLITIVRLSNCINDQMNTLRKSMLYVNMNGLDFKMQTIFLFT